MAYDFYLGKMLCPVAPSELQIKVNGHNKDLTLINGDEINIIKKAGLTDISFDLLLPNVKHPFATYKSGFKNAKYFLDELEKMKSGKKPFQFIVNRRLPNKTMIFDTNIKVSLEEYSISEDAGDGFDFVVSLNSNNIEIMEQRLVKFLIHQFINRVWEVAQAAERITHQIQIKLESVLMLL